MFTFDLDRVGGRTQSVELKTDTSTGTDYWDIGGQWVGKYVINTSRYTVHLFVAVFCNVSKEYINWFSFSYFE